MAVGARRIGPSGWSLVFLLLAVGPLGCTSLPFAPKSGPGAAVTLVTLDTLEDRERAMRRAFEETITQQVEEAVRAAREADRARLDALARDLEAHRVELESLSEQVAANADSSLELGRVMGARLQALAADSAALEARARALESELEGLPLATLEELRRVLGTYVDSETAARAKAAREAAARAQAAKEAAAREEAARAKTPPPVRPPASPADAGKAAAAGLDPSGLRAENTVATGP